MRISYLALALVLCILLAGCSDDGVITSVPAAPTQQVEAPQPAQVIAEPTDSLSPNDSLPNTSSTTIVNSQSFQTTLPSTETIRAEVLELIAEPQPSVKVIVRNDNTYDGNTASKKITDNLVAVELTPDELADIINTTEVYADRDYAVLGDQSIDLTGAPSLWSSNITGESITVAVLDTGIVTHELFNTTTILSQDFTSTQVQDGHGHGTHVAGIVVQTAPGVSLMIGKVLNDAGQGSTSSIASGIYWAVDPDNDASTDDGADIISMSLGAPYNTQDPILNEAITYAIDQGVVVVVAAGNCGPAGGCGGFVGVTTPGNNIDAITVGAVNDAFEWQGFSGGGIVGEGDAGIKPDIVAPGVDIISAAISGDYATQTGTSMSTPIVAGSIALLLSNNVSGDMKTNLLAYAIDKGDIGKDTLYGIGVLNISGPNDSKIITENETEVVHEEYDGYWAESRPANTAASQVLCPENFTGYDPGLNLTYEEFNYLFEECYDQAYLTQDAVSIERDSFVQDNRTIPRHRVKIPANASQMRGVNEVEHEFTIQSLLEKTDISSYNSSAFAAWSQENASYESEALSISLSYYDTYTTASSSSDGKTWGGEYLDVEMDGSFLSGSEVVCYDWCNDGTWDRCYGDTLDDFYDCMDESSVLSTNCANGICYYNVNVEDYHEIDTGNAGDRWKCTVRARYYGHCQNLVYSYEYDTEQSSYYVVDPRRYECTSSSQYRDSGQFDSATVTIFGNYACNADQSCDYSADGSQADFGYYGTSIPDSPCRLNDEAGDCDVDSDCMTNSHCSQVFGTDYCCPNGEEWLTDHCQVICSEGYTGSKRCGGDGVPEWEYRNVDCSATWLDQSSCDTDEKCSTGDCIPKTCNDFVDTYGPCVGDGDKYRIDNYVYECVDQLDWDFNTFLCWDRISQMGDDDFCSEATAAGEPCYWNEYDCDFNSECTGSLECMGPLGGLADGCCYPGEEWDEFSQICYDPCPDVDGDGYYGASGCGTSLDCNDNNNIVYPGAAEICDGIDNNCDASTDEGYDLQNDNSNCGTCGNTCGAGQSCSSGSCQTICGDGICAAGEACVEDCLQIVDFIGEPTLVDSGTAVSFDVRVQNIGTVTLSTELEAAIAPDSWDGTQFTIQSYTSTSKCCTGNEYYAAKSVTLSGGQSQDIPFTVTAPSPDSYDHCTTIDDPLYSAWDNSFTLVAGLYPACGGGYTDQDTQNIDVTYSPTCPEGLDGSAPECSCSIDDDCTGVQICDTNDGFGACVAPPEPCVIPDGSGGDCDCDSERDCEAYNSSLTCNLGPGWDACIPKNYQDECASIDTFSCGVNDGDVYRCEQVGTIQKWVLTEVCSFETICDPATVDTVRTCESSLTYDVELEHASSGTLVFKQPGDIIRVTVHSDTATTYNLEYDTSAFDLVSGMACSSGTYAAGANPCIFKVKDDSLGRYRFKINNDIETVDIITKPYALFLTHSDQLYNRYNDQIGVDVLLARAYEKAAESNAVVYDLSTMLGTAHPFDYPIGDYDQTMTALSADVNYYPEDVHDVVLDRCKGCEHILLIGDDYVLPHYRKNLQLSLSREQIALTDRYYYDDGLTLAYDSTDIMFSRGLFGNRYAGKDVLFVLPDNLSAEQRSALDALNTTIHDVYDVDSQETLGSTITCSDRSLWHDHLMIIVADDPLNNPAMNCFDYAISDNALVHQLMMVTYSPWSYDERAVILGRNPSTIKAFDNIMKSNETHELFIKNRAWYVVDTAIVGSIAVLPLAPVAPTAVMLIGLGAGLTSVASECHPVVLAGASEYIFSCVLTSVFTAADAYFLGKLVKSTSTMGVETIVTVGPTRYKTVLGFPEGEIESLGYLARDTYNGYPVEYQAMVETLVDARIDPKKLLTMPKTKGVVDEFGNVFFSYNHYGDEVVQAIIEIMENNPVKAKFAYRLMDKATEPLTTSEIRLLGMYDENSLANIDNLIPEGDVWTKSRIFDALETNNLQVIDDFDVSKAKASYVTHHPGKTNVLIFEQNSKTYYLRWGVDTPGLISDARWNRFERTYSRIYAEMDAASPEILVAKMKLIETPETVMAGTTPRQISGVLREGVGTSFAEIVEGQGAVAVFNSMTPQHQNLMRGFSVRDFVFGVQDRNFGGFIFDQVENVGGSLHIRPESRIAIIDQGEFGLGFTQGWASQDATVMNYWDVLMNDDMGIGNFIYRDIPMLNRDEMILFMDPEVEKLKWLLKRFKGEDPTPLFKNIGSSLDEDYVDLYFGTMDENGNWVGGRIEEFIDSYAEFKKGQ